MAQERTAFPIVVAVFLCIYALFNFISAFTWLVGGGMIGSISSAVESSEGQIAAGLLYLVSLLLLVTGVFDIVAAIGLFGSTLWAGKVTAIAGVLGIINEIRSLWLGIGFGMLFLIFLVVNILALVVASQKLSSAKSKGLVFSTPTILKGKTTISGYCSQCGTKISSDSKFCEECGSPV